MWYAYGRYSECVKLYYYKIYHIRTTNYIDKQKNKNCLILGDERSKKCTSFTMKYFLSYLYIFFTHFLNTFSGNMNRLKVFG